MVCLENSYPSFRALSSASHLPCSLPNLRTFFLNIHTQCTIHLFTKEPAPGCLVSLFHEGRSLCLFCLSMNLSTWQKYGLKDI